MSDKAWLLNPDDEPLEFMYLAVEYVLKPGLTPMSKEAADHGASVLKEWGVVKLTGDSEADKEARERGSAQYKLHCQKWCEEQALEYSKAAKPYADAGLKLPEPKGDQASALSWLKKAGLVACVLLGFAASGDADHVRKRHVLYRYDLDATAVTYFKLSGEGNNTGTIAGTKPITTSGSSTTVAAVTADDLPFRDLGVGDVLFVQRSADLTTDIRWITAKASGDSVTVNAAVNWEQTGGFAFRWLDFSSGTADTDGWLDYSSCGTGMLTWQLDQMNATSVDVRVEAKVDSLDTKPVVIYPGESSDCGAGGTLASGYCQFGTAGITARFFLVMGQGEHYDAVRVGMKINTDDGGDTGANAEMITITLSCDPGPGH